MAFASNASRAAAGLLAVVATATMIWFGNGLNPWWPLLWFAPLPVLLFALHSSWKSAAIAAAVAMLAGSLTMWHYFHSALRAPAILWITTYSVVALVFLAAVLLFRALVLRGAVWSALLAFPATWVSAEYLGNLTTPNGTAGNLSYTQLKFLPFLQVASVTGPWGMSFLLLLFSAALAIGLYLRPHPPKQAMRVMGLAFGAIGLVLILGVVRLSSSAPGEMVRVGLISSDLRANARTVDAGFDTERLFRDYAREAEALARQGAQIIVMPEKLGVISGPGVRSGDAILQAAADGTGSTIVAGMVRIAPSAQFNEARVYAPGAAVRSYDKRHMLPPFESRFQPGTTLTVMPERPGVWGVAICKDMDFTPLSLEYGKAGVGLMLVPGWDFDIDGEWHGHLAVMRGVEDGFSIVRSAKGGRLTVSDSRGRIVAETRSDSAPFATLMAEVPVAHQNTVYLLLGDWFAWVALGIWGVTLMRLYQVRRNPHVGTVAAFSSR